MKKVLITGATGFIGKHLYCKLRDLKYDVVGISFEGGEINRDKIIYLDITKKEEVDKFIKNKKFNIIFHLAAFIPKTKENYNLEKCLKINGLGTYNLLLAAKNRRVDKFIYSSSASIYSRKNTRMPAKESCFAPENIYGLSKLVGENLCELFRRNFNLKTVSLRYASVYGQGQEPYCVLPLFIEKVLNNDDIEVFGSGKRTQDFIYVKDVINANIKAAFSKTEGVFNIGSGKEISILDLATIILKIYPESKSKIKSKPMVNEDKTRFFLDVKRAKKELNFHTKYSLEDGINDYKKAIYENRNNC